MHVDHPQKVGAEETHQRNGAIYFFPGVITVSTGYTVEIYAMDAHNGDL